MKRPQISLGMVGVAGLAGGLAEVLWISWYSTFTDTSAIAVARGITATVLPGAASVPLPAVAGLAIHLLLSFALGVALAKLLLRYVAPGGLVSAAVAALAAVWALNFLIVLPIVNPAFLTLMPLSTALISKLLFGAAMGWTLERTRHSSV